MLQQLWQRWLSHSFPSLEIHVPISPTPPLLNMARALVLSLRQNGGRYHDAPVVLSVCGSPPISPSPAWCDSLGVHWRPLPAEIFDHDSFWSNAAARYRQPFNSEMVLMLDADVLVAAPFEAMVVQAHRHQALAGLIAYSSPFENTGLNMTWPELFREFGLATPELNHTHTGFGVINHDPKFARCPAYFNQGVVCVPATVAARLGERIPDLMTDIKLRTESPFRLQLAITLAAAKLDVPTMALPMRFNCTNHPDLVASHDREIDRACLLHLHGVGPVPKMELFANHDSMMAYTRRPDLAGVNATAGRVLSEILPSWGHAS